jgi:hypothetical protein
LLAEPEDHPNKEEARRGLATATHWGRHAELFADGCEQGVLGLENP